jgi:hypothetical protein
LYLTFWPTLAIETRLASVLPGWLQLKLLGYVVRLSATEGL